MMLLQEAARALLVRVLEELLGRALLAHHALVEEGHLRRDLLGEAHLVGGQQHRHALGGQLAGRCSAPPTPARGRGQR